MEFVVVFFGDLFCWFCLSLYGWGGMGGVSGFNDCREDVWGGLLIIYDWCYGFGCFWFDNFVSLGSCGVWEWWYLWWWLVRVLGGWICGLVFVYVRCFCVGGGWCWFCCYCVWIVNLVGLIIIVIKCWFDVCFLLRILSYVVG